MREKNNCLRYINFTPYKLKVFKSGNFALKGTPILNRHKTSYSYLNNNRENNHLLIKNPTQNYLFDKINVSNLSTSKILLNKSISNSRSVDCNHNDANKKGKYKNINFYKNNSLKNLNNNHNYYYLKYNNRTPIKNNTTNNNDVIILSELPNLNENYSIKNTNSKIIYLESNKYQFRNRDKDRLKDKIKYNFKIYNDEKKNEKIKKIILIQSFWRSYFLRKLVVGGLEKYYSSIAISKYLINIFFKNKQKLFKFFIEMLKEYIMQKKYSCFKYRKNNNNINIFFKGNDESNGSFEIPNDKKNDCIYFFIKSEQDKSNKPKIINEKIKNNINKNNINIKYYNNKYDKRSRNIKNNKITLYNKKSNDIINKDNFKNRINIKINLINHNNNDNIDSYRRMTNNNYTKIFDKNKIKLNYKLNKIRDKKIYVKKKVGEENNNYNNNNILIKNNSASFKKDKTKEIKIKKDIYKKHLIPFMNLIKRNFIHLDYRIFIYNLKVKVKNNNNKEKKLYLSKLIKILNKIMIKNYFNKIKNKNNDKKNFNIIEFRNKNDHLNSIFPLKNITYYKKKNNKHNYAKLNKKPNLNNQYQKIKVNKNNAIEKNKKSKLLKKIIEKKLNKENILKNYYLIWKNSYKLVYIEFNTNRNLTIEKGEKNRNKSESNKKHIKIKFKKSFTNNTIRSSSYEKSNLLSVNSKKMKVSKLFYDKKNFYSTASSINLPHYKNNIFNRINNDENQFCNKIISLIKKIENKNIIYKSFIDWKKEVRKNKKEN